MTKICIETVKWKSADHVSDQAMIEAAENIVADLKNCEGFLQQVLAKQNGEWVSIYYWVDEKSAHASNEYMADKAAFIDLMSLIEENSVSIETCLSVQASGKADFDAIL